MTDQLDFESWAREHAHKDDPETSLSAALLGCTAAQRHKAIVYRALKQYGPMTGDEVAQVTGLHLYQARRRMSDLSNDGVIEDSGERRMTEFNRMAVVWKLRRET